MMECGNLADLCNTGQVHLTCFSLCTFRSRGVCVRCAVQTERRLLSSWCGTFEFRQCLSGFDSTSFLGNLLVNDRNSIRNIGDSSRNPTRGVFLIYWNNLVTWWPKLEDPQGWMAIHWWMDGRFFGCGCATCDLKSSYFGNTMLTVFLTTMRSYDGRYSDESKDPWTATFALFWVFPGLSQIIQNKTTLVWKILVQNVWPICCPPLKNNTRPFFFQISSALTSRLYQ